MSFWFGFARASAASFNITDMTCKTKQKVHQADKACKYLAPPYPPPCHLCSPSLSLFFFFFFKFYTLHQMFKPVRVVATIIVFAMIIMIFVSAFVLRSGTLSISKSFPSLCLVVCSNEWVQSSLCSSTSRSSGTRCRTFPTRALPSSKWSELHSATTMQPAIVTT